MGRCLGKTLNFERLLIFFGFIQIKGIRFSDELNICAVNFHQLRSPPSYSVHCQKNMLCQLQAIKPFQKSPKTKKYTDRLKYLMERIMIPTGEATALGLTSRPGTWRMEQGRENTPKPRIREGFPNCTDFRRYFASRWWWGKS